MILAIITFRMHPTPGPKLSAGTGSSLAIQPIEVEYFGHPYVLLSHFEIATDQLIVHLYRSHASSAPWEGQNALDAAFLAYSSISVLRQQMKVDRISTNDSFLSH
jgi:Xaa-Arg dipeptidase